MRKLSIDRFEGKYAICEDDKRNAFAIERSELPNASKEGDIIVISETAEITIDTEETTLRRNKIKNLQNNLWKK